MSRKLRWRNVSPIVEKVLYDIRDSRVVGVARLEGNLWKAIYIPREPVHTTTVLYAEEADAKRSITAVVAEDDRADIVIPEPDVLTEIDAMALRNIIAASDLEAAKAIARDVLADPAKWLKRLREEE